MVQIKIDSAFFHLMESNTLLVTGKLPSHLKQMATESGVRVCEYGDHDAIAIPNAVPTAEGAIQLMMEKTPFTVDGSLPGFGVWPGGPGISLPLIRLWGLMLWSPPVIRSN